MTNLLTDLADAVTAVLSQHGAEAHREALLQALSDRLLLPAGEASPAFVAKVCALFNAEVLPH